MIRLARALPDLHITAIDASAPMITLARGAVMTEGLSDRIELVQGYVPGVALNAHSFDAVLSKDLLHHVPDPSVLWKEIARLAQAWRCDLRDGPGSPTDARRGPSNRGPCCGPRGSDPARGLLQFAVRRVHRRRASRTGRRCRTRPRGQAGQRPARAHQRSYFTLALAFRRSAQSFLIRSDTALRSAAVIVRTRLRTF